jgi:outer membrane protein TolC
MYLDDTLNRTDRQLFRQIIFLSLSLLTTAFISAGQDSTTSAPLTISFSEALGRAAKYASQLQAADIALRLAAEDVKQANAARLPSGSVLNQYIYTEGNGTPSGVFVANDGVHVYNEQLVGHEDLFAFFRRGEVRQAQAAEAVARAKADVAARGLRLTVTQDYYGIAVAEHKLANAQESLTEANRFLDITHKQEIGGEAAHADVIKAQIEVQTRQRDLEDAQLAVFKAKSALAVLIFPVLRFDFSVVDDLSELPTLPPVLATTAQIVASNPDLKAAQATFSQARWGLSVAKYAYLPSFALDVNYGLDANELAIVGSETQSTGRSTLPNYIVGQRQNLGYSASATLTVPLWDWGSIRSKVRQADLKQQQAKLDLSLTERQLQADLASAYHEAESALNQVASLKSSADLSNEGLRLTLLRYEAGEATALEAVDAQNTLNLARGAYDDGLLRYRVAFANLQNLAGGKF